MSKNDNILEFKNISKYFPGVQALENISFVVKKGEVHCLVGENGAGKSTLIKILAGAIERNEGNIIFDGEKVEIRSVHEALELGIAIIFQESNVVDQLSVYENIFLGKEKTRLGFINKRKEIKVAEEHLKQLGLDFSTQITTGGLSSAEKQMIEISRALIYKSKLIVMDEPSAILAERDVQKLFNIIKELRNQGISVIYISHRLEEIFEIGDTVTVLRNGKMIGTSRIKSVTKDELIKMIVGRTLLNKYPIEKREVGSIRLEMKGLSVGSVLKDINFVAKKGEITGIFGLVGSGRTELARAIFGADPIDSGEIFIDGEKVSILKPSDSIKVGIGLIPEERREQGLVTKLNIRENITLASLRKITSFGFVSRESDISVAKKYVKELNIKTPSLEQIIANLSGGNQQKVVISKWLSTNSKILIMDEPTKGIDVGTKSEIYKIISDLAGRGTTIIVFSSEIEEVIGISDRIFVMCDGCLKEYLDKYKKPEKILSYAMGVIN